MLVRRRSLWIILLLATLAFATDSDPAREKTLWTQIHCNCGCGDVLAECSHVECKRKSALKQEIAAAILADKSEDKSDGQSNSKSDQAILDAMAAKYGSTILVVPAFRGFNTLLWLVPVGVAVLSLAGLILSRRRSSSAKSPVP
jgi:cytochrome c-type biogenesis protein CcmH/NrfF